MRPTRRDVLGAIGVTTALAGCLDGGGGDTSPTSTPTDTATPADDGMAVTLSVSTHAELGDILVGSDGMTLYMFEQDTQGQDSSACTGSCADAWPPLTVDGEPTTGENVTAEVTTFEREDGGTQVAAGGWPLYHFASDQNPGDAKGHGSNDVWWVVSPDGTPARETSTETATATATEGDGAGPY